MVLGLEPWVWFSLGANLFLAASDYIVSMFGTMGPKMMMYYCAGPIVACFIYYSGQSMGWIARSKRSLLKTEDGETDSTALFWTIANVIAQASIVILLNINFHLSILADLNIGIAQTVHASQAFFVALLDFVIFGAFLEKSQITGMLIILVCVFFISFSSDSSIPDEPSVQTKLAVYIPILFSFTVPCAQAANIMISKRVTTVLGVNPWDFTVGVYAIMATVFQLWGFIYWYNNPGTFDLHYFILGAFGSILQVTGVLCLNLAITTARAAGPAIAIVSTQMIVLTLASAIIAGFVPNLMQWMGLVFGLIGAMVLVIPDKVKKLVPCLGKE